MESKTICFLFNLCWMNFPHFLYHAADFWFIWLSPQSWQTDLNLFFSLFSWHAFDYNIFFFFLHFGPSWSEPLPSLACSSAVKLKCTGKTLCRLLYFPCFSFSPRFLATSNADFHLSAWKGMSHVLWQSCLGSRYTPGANTASCIITFKFSKPRRVILDLIESWAFVSFDLLFHCDSVMGSRRNKMSLGGGGYRMGQSCVVAGENPSDK